MLRGTRRHVMLVGRALGAHGGLILLGPSWWEPPVFGAVLSEARAARQMVCRCPPRASLQPDGCWRAGCCARLGRRWNVSCDRGSAPPGPCRGSSGILGLAGSGEKVALRHGMARHSMAWHCMGQHSMARYGSSWHGMAQQGMAWDSIAWHGTSWCGMARHAHSLTALPGRLGAQRTPHREEDTLARVSKGLVGFTEPLPELVWMGA